MMGWRRWPVVKVFWAEHVPFVTTRRAYTRSLRWTLHQEMQRKDTGENLGREQRQHPCYIRCHAWRMQCVTNRESGLSTGRAARSRLGDR